MLNEHDLKELHEQIERQNKISAAWIDECKEITPEKWEKLKEIIKDKCNENPETTLPE